jgi:hypothetical protein
MGSHLLYPSGAILLGYLPSRRTEQGKFVRTCGFSRLQNVHTGSGAQLASYTIGIGDSFVPGKGGGGAGKRPECEVEPVAFLVPGLMS